MLTVPAFGKFLASLRLVRLARLLRLLRLGAILTRAVQRERLVSSGTAFRFAALLTAFVVIVGGAAQSLVDRGDFHSTWNGIWWAMQTVTTVGYGDVQVRSVSGRVIAMLVMLIGIGFLSVLTATVASHFVQNDTGSDEMMQAITRIEKELADLKAQLLEPGGS